MCSKYPPSAPKHAQVNQWHQWYIIQWCDKHLPSTTIVKYHNHNMWHQYITQK